MKLAPVKDHTALVKDLNTGAIINTDKAGVASFRAKKRQEQNKEARIISLEQKVDKITELLERLLNVPQS